MNKKVVWMFRFCLPVLMLLFVVGAARAAWPIWKGGEYYNDTYTDPFNQMYWSATFSGSDFYSFLGDSTDSLAGKWLNLVLSDDVNIRALRARKGDHTASYTINLDMNGKNLISEYDGSKEAFWQGGEGADPGAVLNVTNSGAAASVISWAAFRPAYETNTMGTVNISGPNVTLVTTNTAPIFGHAGKGTLNVTGGAVFNSGTMVLGGTELGVGAINVSGIGTVVTSGNVYAWSAGSGAIHVKDGGEWYSIGNLQFGDDEGPGFGTILVSGSNSVFSALRCQLWDGTLTVADGAHFEIRNPSSVNNHHVVGPNGTLRFDNGTLSSAGRWTFRSGSTVEFVLKDARTTPFLDVDNEWVNIFSDVEIAFEMDKNPDLKVNDFIPLAHGSSIRSTFDGYPDGYEFSVPYGEYAYTFRINYNIGPSGDKNLGLTVLGIPPSGTVLMIR